MKKLLKSNFPEIVLLACMLILVFTSPNFALALMGIKTFGDMVKLIIEEFKK